MQPAELAKKILQAIPLPVLLITHDERIAAVNLQVSPILAEDIVGRHYITVLRQPELLDAVEGVLRDGAPREARFLGREVARETTYKVSVRAVEGGLGQGAAARRAALLTFEDLTEIENAGRMRRDFVANVSHELRTPLTALLGFIETLRGAARNDPAARERFLGIMESEAKRMSQLVADLLSLSRVEENARRRPTAAVDLVALVQDAVHVLAPLVEKAGVVIETNLPEQATVVPGDPDQLRQVLANLLENAIKYGAQGKRVVISLSSPAAQPMLRGQGVELVVQDFGEGIASHHIPRLTERFYRVDRHRSREVGGTGLGLAIVKHIVERHRGRMRIESAPGKGTKFRIILPSEIS